MSDPEIFRLTPKGQLISAVMSVFPYATMEKAIKVWEEFNDSVYDHAAMSSDPEINQADFLAIVLDGHGGDLMPVERDDL